MVVGDPLAMVGAVALINSDRKFSLALRANRHVAIERDAFAGRLERIARTNDLPSVRSLVAKPDYPLPCPSFIIFFSFVPI